MKFLALLATLAIAPAAPTTFASCSGDHHGTYLEFKKGSDGKFFVETSNDSDEPALRYDFTSIKKNGVLLAPSAYSWAIRQAIRGPTNPEGYGMLVIKATSAQGDQMVINLNKYTNDSHILMVNDYMEVLACPVDRLVDG